MTTKRIEIPPKLVPVFAPYRGDVRYRGAYGGRGSAKSMTFAKMAAVFGAVEPLRILCTRDLQNSITESFHAELKKAIQGDSWLESCYDVGVNYIRGHNGTEFMFRGLRHSMGAIKSTAQIDICIVEEAEDVSESAYIDLIPTIRADKSEIWLLWNPKKDGSATDKRFKKSQPPRTVIAELNYKDNPWFPAELEEARLDDLERLDRAKYRHIWEGQYLRLSESQIFKKYKEKQFEVEPHWDGPYLGVDFGFAKDPTVAVECYIFDSNLYIRRSCGKVGLELDDTSRFIKNTIPSAERYKSYADSARPESISYLSRHGMPRIAGVKKWPGSIEDGIEYIKSFGFVYIHPDCEDVTYEFDNYSYKVDKNSGDVLPVIFDEHNHYIDAIRYALSKMIRKKANAGNAVKVCF